MQPLHPKSLFTDGADGINPPAQAHATGADKTVPDSFAEWLSQPSPTISAESEPEQDIILDVIAGNAAQPAAGLNPPSARA